MGLFWRERLPDIRAEQRNDYRFIAAAIAKENRLEEYSAEERKRLVVKIADRFPEGRWSDVVNGCNDYLKRCAEDARIREERHAKIAAIVDAVIGAD